MIIIISLYSLAVYYNLMSTIRSFIITRVLTSSAIFLLRILVLAVVEIIYKFGNHYSLILYYYTSHSPVKTSLYTCRQLADYTYMILTPSFFSLWNHMCRVTADSALPQTQDRVSY